MDLSGTLQVQAIAAVGIALLVTLCWAMGFRQRASITTLQPFAQGESLVLTEALIDEGGRGGIGLSDDGRLLVAKVMGADIAVRVMPIAAIEAVLVRGGQIHLTFQDLGFPSLNLNVGAPPLWIGRLAR